MDLGSSSLDDYSSPTCAGYLGDPSYIGSGIGDPSEGLETQKKHAQHAARLAQAAAAHAETLAGHAHALAQWVQKLYGQQQSLQEKVNELEDWKKKTLEEMRRLREEHKNLRKKFGPDDPVQIVELKKAQAVTLPPPQSEKWVTLDKTAPLRLENISEAKEVLAASSERVGLERTNTGNYVDGSDEPNEGVKTTDELVEGAAVKRTTWRIGHLSVKLRGCMGRALVSPPFESWGMKDLRLMLFPDLKQNQNRDRKAKELYQKKVTEGPLDGSVKLKVPETLEQPVLTYCFTLGSQPKDGSLWKSHDFSQLSVSEQVPFSENWLQELEKDGTLVVTVDIVNPVFS